MVEPKPWIDLTAEIQRAREKYHALCSLPIAVPDLDQTFYEWIGWLNDVNDCMARGDVLAALNIGGRPPLLSAPEQHKRTLLQRLKSAAQHKAWQLIGDEWAWPDEIDTAESIVESLRHLNGALGLAWDDGVNDLEEAVHGSEGVQTLLEDLRHSLGLIDEKGGFTNDFLPLLLDLENSRIDVALGQALDRRIEVFDRATLLEADVPRCRVETLIATRDAQRLIRRLDEIHQRAIALAGNLQALIAHLVSEVEALGNARTQVEQTAQSYADLATALEQQDIDRRLDMMAIRLDRLDVVHKALKNLDSHWVDALERAEDIRSRSEFLRDRVREADLAMQSACEQGLKMQGAEEILSTSFQSLTQTLSNASQSLKAAKTAKLAVLHVLVAAGLQAVRQLRLDSEPGSNSAHRAAELLEQAQAWVSMTKPGGGEAVAALKLLDESIRWLQQLAEEPTALACVREWREAVLAENLAAADAARVRVVIALRGKPDIRLGWVVGELQGQHEGLRSRLRLSAGIGAPVQPVAPAAEEQAAETEELFQALQVEDDPANLSRIGEVLESLKKKRGLSFSELTRLGDELSWYGERKAFAKSGEELSRSWQVARCNTTIEPDAVRQLLLATENFIRNAPRHVSEPYLAPLKSQLQDAFMELSKSWKPEHLELTIWLGILRFCTVPRDELARKVAAAPDTLVQELENLLAQIPPEKRTGYLLSIDRQFNRALERLALINGLSPHETASSVCKSLETTELFRELSLWEQSRDAPEYLSDCRKLLEQLQSMPVLTLDQQKSLEMWRRFIEGRVAFVDGTQSLWAGWNALIPSLKDRTSDARVESLVRQSIEAFKDAPVLPAAYWHEPERELQKIHEALYGSRSDFAEQTRLISNLLNLVRQVSSPK